MEKINYNQILNHLKKDGVLAYPTETLWGLGGLASSRTSVKSVYQLKQRKASMPVSLLVKDSDMAAKYCNLDVKLKKLLDIYWPGPVSFVLPKLNDKFNYLNNGSDFISLRCSSHQFCTDLFLHLDEAVVTTSANKSGVQDAKSFKDLDWLPSEVLKINDSLFTSQEIFSSGSVIIKIKNTDIEVLRPGPFDIDTHFIKNLLLSDS